MRNIRRYIMKKITMKKRIASMALAMVMLLSYIPGAVWAVDASTDIKAISKPTGKTIVEDYDDYFGEGWENKLGLPASVTVTMADDTTAEAPVTWDTSPLDPRTPGYYYLPGTVTLPVGATNSQNLDVTITIQVQEKINLFANSDFESCATAGPTGWEIPGANPRYTSTYVRSGKYAAWAKYTTATKTSINGFNKSTGTTDDSAPNVAARVNAMGAGQYYFGIYARKGESDVAVNFYTQFFYKYGEQTDVPSSQKIKGTQFELGTEYAISGGVVELPANLTSAQLRFNFVKTDTTTSFTGIGIYLDDAELVPLNVPLKAEPSNIAEIKTELLSRFVAVNYDKYAGNDWQSSLGLPETVEILTDKGETGSLKVTWDYSQLDVTKCGKYTLVGTLDDSAYPNPKGLTVQQNIYIRKVENLFTNSGFEEGKTGWSTYGDKTKLTPAAEGKYAIGLKSSKSNNSDYNMVFPNTTHQKQLANLVAAAGAGQYYISAQARDFLYDDETAHTDALSVYIKTSYKTDANAKSWSFLGNTQEVTLSSDRYVTTGGIFDFTGEEAAIYPVLYLKSATKFASQWILADDMQFLPINVLIPKGEEPADIVEVTSNIPVRAVVQNYDKYVGANWQEALGLPAKVEVKTTNGVTGSVNVTWDYSPLNLTKTGKYVLVGTLDDSAYPNPDNLYVTQTIYIREAKNLISNGGFEGGKTSWGWGSDVEASATPAAEGKFALALKSSAKGTTSASMLISSGTTALAQKIAEAGAGQYYLGVQVRDYLHSGETTHTEPLETVLRLRYKKDVNASSSSLKGETDKITLTETYQESSGVFNLDGDEVWARVDLYMLSSTKFADQWILVDDVQFIPLNVTVQTYEGAAEEVLTIIPERNIIQNYPNYIAGYTTADLLFPETVEVRSTKGEIVKVGVQWDYNNLNLSKLGTYTLTGVLEDMQLANPNALTVDQVVHVVSYQNLLTNGGFEDADDHWTKNDRVSILGVTSPVRNGDMALEFTIGTMPDYKSSWLQAFFSNAALSLGEKVTATGGGRYFFGSWAHGTESSLDMQVETRFLYKNAAKGDTTTTKTSSKINLSASQYIQSGDVVDVPDDITWSRMDIYFYGTPDQMRLSKLYLDQLELVPLNVEIPNMNDIISCEDPAHVYVHEGTSFAGLNLPSTLQVQLKNGQRFEIGVTWDKSTYDCDKIGDQTITGTLNLGGKYANTKGFAPVVQITVRAKGEDLRQTIYISTSGSEDNDGLSPDSPKQDVTKIPTYLKQGYNVRLKRGDIWYLPKNTFSLKDIYGTAEAPLVIGAYGSGDKLPVIGFLAKVENSAWKLVDAKRNVYAADVSSVGTKNGISAHRLFVNDEAYVHQDRTNYVALKAGQYCSYDGTLYIRTEGGAPENVEFIPNSAGGPRITIERTSHLTIEFIHIKGGSPVNNLIRMNAPTEYIKLQYLNITHSFYYQLVMEASDERVNYKPEISHCYIDLMFSQEEADLSGVGGDPSVWDAHLTEGITMRDGVDGAWIHHNTIRDVSHAYIAIESLDRSSDYKTTGVRNCIIEDNLLDGSKLGYARAFNICGGPNLSGTEMCRDNTFRRNRCYGMSTASHLFGMNNLIYSNVFSFLHCKYNEEGELRDGKGAVPWAFDTYPYNGQTSVGNMVINNTFYVVGSAVGLIDKSNSVYNTIYANNLIVNYTSDSGTYSNIGAISDNTIGLQYVMNNGVYADGRVDHFMVDSKIYTAEDVNGVNAGYSGNIFADPKFLNADLTLSGTVVQDFTLSSESPMRYAGLSLYNSVYENFPAWERLKAEYTDLNGVVYLAESPSIGAISYSEKITGEVASVGKLKDVVARTGAEFSQLFLPETVSAVSKSGIDVMLLITWSDVGFDSSKPGTVTITGELRNGPHTDLNIAGKTVSVNIQIKDRLELMNIETQLNNLTVFYNTSLEDVIAQLPQTLKVRVETGFEEELPVTWTCENYNPTVPDVYTFKCVLPESMLTNADEWELEVEVRVLHEIGRGMELLINPDFIDGTSPGPWKFGWGTGNFKVTQDPEYLLDGEPASAIVTAEGRYGSLQQDVTGQVKLLGAGKYLFRCYMRSYLPLEPINSSYACLQVQSPSTYTQRCRAIANIGEEWVEFYSVMDVHDVDEATQIMFHTSTGKTADDAKNKRSYVIAGCSFIFLGTTDEEVEATLDSVGLTWNTIKGENESEKNVMSDLTLPSTTGEASKITWSSSDETVITSDGKVTMGRLPKTVILTADIAYKNGIVTTKKFTVTVPRDPQLPVFSAAISKDQTVKTGDEFQVTISLDSKNATVFNVYRFTLSFSTSRLEFVGISDPNSKVEVDGGRIVISGMGTERPITDTITLTFRAKKDGVTDIKLASVEMDYDPNASLDSLPTMTVTKNAATITIEKVESGDDAIEDNTGKDNTATIWIVIGLVAAALICGGVIAFILIKKKNQTPPEEN